MYSAPSSCFHAWRGPPVSQETKTTSVSALRKESRFSCRSRASSSQTGVKANGWKTSRTFRRPAKSDSRTRSSLGHLQVELGRPVPVSIATLALLAVPRRPIVAPSLELLREVVELEAARVVVRVDVALAVAELLRAAVVRIAQHRRRPEVADASARPPAPPRSRARRRSTSAPWRGRSPPARG